MIRSDCVPIKRWRVRLPISLSVFFGPVLIAGCGPVDRAPPATEASQTRSAETSRRLSQWTKVAAPRGDCVNTPVRRGGDHRPLYDVKVLGEVIDRVRAASRDGLRPVVVFDLDDTLLDNRPRTLNILREFGKSFPPDSVAAAGLAELDVSHISYSLADNLGRAGVTAPADVDAATKFWRTKFFSDEYLWSDVAVPGAVAYVRALADVGAFIIYLTGRPEREMGKGTRESLRANGFPLDDSHARVALKADAGMSDLEFKLSELGKLAHGGKSPAPGQPARPVVMTAENEPINLAAMRLVLPNAVLLYVDTDHDPRNDDAWPPGAARWVPDFRQVLSR